MVGFIGWLLFMIGLFAALALAAVVVSLVGAANDASNGAASLLVMLYVLGGSVMFWNVFLTMLVSWGFSGVIFAVCSRRGPL